MASASITRNCVNGSSSGPPQPRGIAIPKTPASFIAAAMLGGIRRPRSISSPAARICSASPIAACRTGGSSAVACPAACVILIGSSWLGVTIAGCSGEVIASMWSSDCESARLGEQAPVIFGLNGEQGPGRNRRPHP